MVLLGGSSGRTGSIGPAIHFCKLKEDVMGKYFIAWLLGVPLVVLVLIYLIF